MPYWLMKSEPDELSIQTLQRMGQARWDGVRNYQARNYLREMADGDLFLFYHSSCPRPGVAGIGRLQGPAYADPTALQADSAYFDARAAAKGSNPWLARDVAWVETFEPLLDLSRLRDEEALDGLELLRKGSRLSVMPVSEEHWKHLCQMATSQH